jgi:tetratricopeptide (TPR) repeat protein
MVVACGDGLFPGEHQIESALLRDVAYGGLLKRVQRRCHVEAAEFIAEQAMDRIDDVAALLAKHYDAGGEPARAFHLYRRAGQRALSVFANEDAIHALGKALELQQAAGEAGTAAVAELHEELGDVLLHIGEYHKARREFLAALATPAAATPLLRRADLHRKIGKTYYLTQDLQRALEMLRGALEAAGPQPSAVAMDVQAEIGWVHYLLGHPDESERQLRRGMELAHALGDEGRAQHGTVSWERALANLQSTLGAVALSRGRRNEALGLYETARAHFSAAGLQSNAAGCDLNMGLSLVALDRSAEALLPLRRALDVFEMLGHREGMAAAQVNLGRANHRLARLGRAEGHLMAGRTIAEELGVATRLCEACAFSAELSLDRGQVDRALVEAQRAVAEADRSQVVELRGMARRVLGRVLASAQRADEAGQTFEQALDLVGAVGQPDELAATCEAYGLVCLTSVERDRRRQGETLLRRAVDIYRETGLPGRAAAAEDALKRSTTTAG